MGCGEFQMFKTPPLFLKHRPLLFLCHFNKTPMIIYGRTQLQQLQFVWHHANCIRCSLVLSNYSPLITTLYSLVRTTLVYNDTKYSVPSVGLWLSSTVFTCAHICACRVRSEPGGTRWRMGGEVKGKLANGVGSQYSHATSERGLSSITQADAHTSAASSRLNWRPHRFKWTRPFRGKTKSGFCAFAITFRTSYTYLYRNFMFCWPCISI